MLKAGLSSALLVLGLLVAIETPSTILTGVGPATVTLIPPGRLLVSVALNNGSAIAAPLSGVQVGITEPVLHGLHIRLATNRSGEVEITLQPGYYRVSVGNSKFALSDSVPINSGQLTHVQVALNRSAYYTTFTAAEDSTTQGTIEPWNTIVVAVPTTGYPITALWNLGAQQVIIVPVVGQAHPSFGETVFVQTVRLDVGGPGGTQRLEYGAEVPATVLSQTDGAEAIWLSLKPSAQLQVVGALYLMVISYEAGSVVSVSID